MKSKMMIVLAGIWLIASAVLENFYDFFVDGLILLSGVFIFSAVTVLAMIKSEDEVNKQ